MKNSKWILVTLGLIFTLILIKSFDGEFKPSSNQKETEEIVNETTDEIGEFGNNWKNYSNEAKGYTIQYPSETYLREICPDEELTLLKRERYEGYKNTETSPQQKESCARDFSYDLEISTHSDNQNLEIPQTNSNYSVEKESIKISEIDATRYTATWTAENQSQAPLWYTKVLIEKENITYEIYFSDKDNLELFNKILSSFELLN